MRKEWKSEWDGKKVKEVGIGQSLFFLQKMTDIIQRE